MTRPNAVPRSPIFRRAVLAGALSLIALQANAVNQTYTLNADFDLGTLINLNHGTSDQLQLNTVTSTFPVLWIANAGEDTVSKFDTVNNKEIARYRTWFGPSGQVGYQPHLGAPWTGPAPSRTAVDINGNAYVANRHFDGRPAMVMKILANGGIDRNLNGVIDTSSDLNSDGVIGTGEIKDMADVNNNGILDSNEITDERIAWAVPVGPANGLGRALCIGTDGNLWIGLFNTRQFWKISSVNGSVLAGPVDVSWTPYGCLIDQQGNLWSASLQDAVLGKITGTDNNSGHVATSYSTAGRRNYGIALGNGKVYLGTEWGGNYIKFDPVTNTMTWPNGTGPGGIDLASTGIGVDGAGNIIIGNSGTGGVAKFKPDDTCFWPGCLSPTQWSGDTRGVIPDQNNDIWQVSRTGSRLMKYRGTDGAALGVYTVGDQPYTYSDASGSTLLGTTTPTGTWTVIKDGGASGVKWGTVNWNATIPPGANLSVQVRTADNQTDLPLQPFVPISKNTAFSANGRYIEIETRLTANQQDQSPILYDLTVNSLITACDVDKDGDVDMLDINLIRAGIGQIPVAGDRRDATGDGKITINDVRACILKCTRANCATN